MYCLAYFHAHSSSFEGGGETRTPAVRPVDLRARRGISDDTVTLETHIEATLTQDSRALIDICQIWYLNFLEILSNFLQNKLTSCKYWGSPDFSSGEVLR